MEDGTTLDWEGMTLSEVSFVTLRAVANDPSGRTIQLTYDRGLVSVTSIEGTAQSTEVLGLRQIRALLDALRVKSRLTASNKQVDSAALRAMIGALARVVHSPGPFPFSAATFGTIERVEEAIVGQLRIDGDVTAVLRDENLEITLETRRPGAKGRLARRLTIQQLRDLVAALQLRVGLGSVPAADLWLEVLASAKRRLAAVEEAMALARGGRTSAR